MAARRKGEPVHGWLVLDKPAGAGSTRMVSEIKRLFDADKAGHAGTLDPLASGLLPIALGEATKTVSFIMEGSKTYRFSIAWGEETPTDDGETAPTALSSERPSEAAILGALPDFTGSHPADMALFMPIFHGDRLFGFAASKAHLIDVGAKDPYPVDSTEAFQEGILFPPLKLRAGTEINHDLIKLVELNSRMPAETAGSILGAMAALSVAVEGVDKVIEEHGLDVYDQTVTELLDHGERFVRAEIAKIPDGTYVVERSLDAMGKRSKKRRDRLEVVGEYADFYVEKLPGLIDEWRKRSKSL